MHEKCFMRTYILTKIFLEIKDIVNFVKHWMTNNIRPSFIDFMKTKYPDFNQLDSLEKLKIILNSEKEILPSVSSFIKRSLEARI